MEIFERNNVLAYGDNITAFVSTQTELQIGRLNLSQINKSNLLIMDLIKKKNKVHR